MKSITRDAIQRMVEGGGSGGSGGGGGTSLAGYATEMWVAQNFLTLDFFNSLFEARTSGGTAVEPNAGDTTTINNIKAKFGFWTEQYVSALGQNSGGGGGGGATQLSDLVDVEFSGTLTNGQVLKYNSTTGKWYNGTDEGVTTLSWNNITNKPTTLGGYGITDAYISSGTIYLGGSSITPLTSAVTSIATGTGLTGGTITSSGTISINSTYQTYISHGETAYGWGNHANEGYWKTGTGNHPTTLAGYGITDALADDTTFWGQTAVNGVVGGALSFFFNGASSYTSRILEDVSGRIQVDASNGIRIGDGVLIWDSTNNALKVQKSDGSAANLYALGSISALGFQSGATGLDSATISTLLTNRVNFANTNNYLLYESASSVESLTLKSSGSVYMNHASTWFDTNGALHLGRFYVNQQGYANLSGIYLSPSPTSPAVYLTTDGSDLLLTIGSTTYKLTKTSV